MIHQTIHQNVSIKKSLWQGAVTDLLTPELCELLNKAHQQFSPVRLNLLRERELRQAKYDAGEVPTYLASDSPAKSSAWQVTALPQDLKKRRVEITGPVNDTKMVINMLSANQDGILADTAMLDFEDSMMSSWNNVVSGLQNILGVAKENLVWQKKNAKGEIEKEYKLDAKKMALPMIRVRGLHLDESNLKIDNQVISAGMFDLCASVFLTSKLFLKQGKTPKFYIPKCEHYLEARWWNNLFSFLEKNCDLPQHSLRCTLLIETLPAAFQMEEILFEIKDHAAALNVGRWDKIFSDIKVLKNHPDRLSADRSKINMLCPWMENYAKHLIKICHARGAMAIGGMSAFTPGKSPELRQEQTNKVMADKKREFDWGHDGCWVSHPYFITHALAQFPKENQLDKSLADFPKQPDLLMQGSKEQSLEGLKTNIRVGIAYLQGWNNQLGCVSWDDLMEDLATLEISRAQIWQWRHHKAILNNKMMVDEKLIKKTFQSELKNILSKMKNNFTSQEWPQIEKQFVSACAQAEKLYLQQELAPFLTLASPEA